MQRAIIIVLFACTVLGEELTWKYADRNLEEALRDLGLHKFLDLLETTKIDRELWKPNNRLTLFAPTDQAFDNFQRSFEAEKLPGSYMEQLARSHMASEEWLSKAWTNEDLIPTLLSGLNIRVNSYNTSKKTTVTLSGSELTSDRRDLRTQNGIIHVLSSVIFPIPATNVFDTAKQISECGHFLNLVERVGLARNLRYTDGITLFLPVNNAFKKVPSMFLYNLESELPTALADLVRYHVVEGTFYLQGLTNQPRLLTWESNSLHIRYTGAGEKHLFVINGNSKVVKSYPVSNGVVHLIDSLLIPPASPKQMFYAHQKPHLSNFRR